MTHDKPERPPLGLSLAQVIGSALAAVSAALFASFAGTTGTIIGAAVGSVVATIGAATYTWSLRRTSEAALRRAARVRQRALAAAIRPRTVVEGPMRPTEDHEGPVEPPVSEDRLSDDLKGEEEEPDQKLPWGKMLAASVALTIAVLGGITLVEVITGSPISSLLGGSDSQGTTVGNVVRPEKVVEQDTDNQTDSPAPSQAPQPSSPVAPEPSAPAPSDAPAPAPSQPAQPSASTGG